MSWPAEECDAPGPVGAYLEARPDGTGGMVCRCLVCARCGHHTGNTTQGHWWAWCKVRRETMNHHFCCPGDCEMNATGMATLKPTPGRRTLMAPVHPDLNTVVADHLPRAGFRGPDEVV